MWYVMSVTNQQNCSLQPYRHIGATALHMMENDMSCSCVRNAFFILSEEEQMIVGLSVFGGYNSTEIGKTLSLKPGTVRVKRSRALEKMQCVLDGRTFYE